MSALKYPDPLTAFELLYSLAAADGREEALFGTGIDLARPAAARSLIGESFPCFYLEFPLTGAPCFDLLTGYGELKPGARFAPGGGYGFQAVFDWFASLPPGHGASCGIAVDTGGGNACAGVYLQQRGSAELTAPFLSCLGERARLDDCMRLRERMPEGMESAYVGLFPGRKGAPMRIGGYMSGTFLKTVAAEPGRFGACLDRIGFTAYTEPMLDRCAELVSLVPGADYQFDVFPDGTLGDVFGLSLSFNRVQPQMAAECMDSGFGRVVMTLLERWGLADDRWKRIAGAAMASAIRVERADGGAASLALMIRFNYLKVKFKAGEPVSAKFYLLLQAAELPRSPEESGAGR